MGENEGEINPDERIDLVELFKHGTPFLGREMTELMNANSTGAELSEPTAMVCRAIQEALQAGNKSLALSLTDMILFGGGTHGPTLDSQN